MGANRISSIDYSSPSSNDGESPERWLFLVFAIWGSVIALVVLWLDRNPLAATIWVVVGLAFGHFTSRFVHPFLGAYIQWFDRLRNDEQRVDITDFLLRENLNLDEAAVVSDPIISQWAEEGMSRVMLAMPGAIGLFHGVLIGGIFGSLLPLDSTVSWSSAYCALLGVVAGPILLVSTYGIAIGFFNESYIGVTPRYYRRQRLLLLLSPLLTIPAVWCAIKSQIRTWRRRKLA